MSWHLPHILDSLHREIEQKLVSTRRSIGHPGTKGDATEVAWRDLIATYLPHRYKVAKAHVCDSENRFSDQLDIVIYDRQYSPLIFKIGDEIVIPAESVYAVFEAKQTVNGEFLDYASNKVASVRSLVRTSLPIRHAGGVYAARDLPPIIGGILSLDSDWTPPLGSSLTDRLSRLARNDLSRLDIGCAAAHGRFTCGSDGKVSIASGKPATAFLFELIVRLQELATVPMLDLQAYGRWLDHD